MLVRITPQRKFIDWKKTKLFRFRWNWVEEKMFRGIRQQFPPSLCRRGWGFCRYCSCGENALERGEWKLILWKLYIEKINSCIFLFKNPFTLLFKKIVSRESIFIKFCDISAFLCALMFSLMGQCHKIFSFRFFSWIILPQASENPQICELTKFVTFADLPHVWQFGDLRIADPIFFVRFANLRFADPIFVADLQLPQICKFFIFLFTNTYLKCTNSNFYQIKNSAKQACS